jgi:O-acetyl-ADP-ribose deacetylase (regulator of RNase III)
VVVLAASFDVILCDVLPDLVRAWQRAFAAYPEVEVQRGDLLEVEADAYVSPANSYGIMDGGIDAVLSTRFPHVEARVQAAIAAGGRLLPVGHALVVETGDLDVPYLICAPTMEVPSRVGHTSNAFRAMLALLSAVEQFNAENEDAISSIAIPGLCTGVGDMEPEVAALQMAQAYAEWCCRQA